MNKEIDKYSILEVEQFIGVPRTKIRYYMNKGLLDVQKEDSNGYYYYTFKDLVRICQIVYYREKLGFSIEKTEKLLRTSDVSEIEAIIKDQLVFLDDEIKLHDQQRNTMIFNREMIERQKKYQDQIILVPFDAAYIVPYNYYFIPYHQVYHIVYGASEFSFDNGVIKHIKKCCLVFDKDAKFVDADAFEHFRLEGDRVEAGMCIYTVALTNKSPFDPSFLEPAIAWAAKHHFRIKGRIFVTHFFPFYGDDDSYIYVESYLPIDLDR